jgi:hypothetical protein
LAPDLPRHFNEQHWESLVHDAPTGAQDGQSASLLPLHDGPQHPSLVRLQAGQVFVHAAEQVPALLQVSTVQASASAQS